METIVLYCKSYHKDIDRVKILLDSINKFNKDNIPFYISVPSNDINIFQEKLGNTGYILIKDKDIEKENQGWNEQQVIKAQFWKLGITSNYLCIDSDSQFIKPFYKSDFLYSENIPYTVCHEQKDLFEWTQKNLPFDPQVSFQEDRKKIMSLFGREGKYYDFGPSPIIWNSQIWEQLETNYIKPNNITFSDLIKYSPSEFTWYGEYLLYSKLFPIYPIQPLFKVFHYKEQYLEYKNKGYTLEDLAKNYLGIILQSNWDAPLKY